MPEKRSGEDVVLFPTCLMDMLFPDAASAAERVLRRTGCDVEFRQEAVCCGQPAWNSGHVEQARRVAHGALEGLQGPEPVVVCSGSCTTMIHEYWPQLFAGTRFEALAEDVASKVREFSSFVAERVSSLPTMRLATSVTYHDSCHMLRALGIYEAPRTLIDAIEGTDLREMQATERCCGFGGTFSIRYPELSCAMADEKVEDAAGTGATCLVSSDVGCLMHICGRAAARGKELKGRYIAELLDDAMVGDPP